MTDLIIIAVVAVITALAAWYVYKAKKSGKKCIGCPCNTSDGKCSGCSGTDMK